MFFYFKKISIILLVCNFCLAIWPDENKLMPLSQYDDDRFGEVVEISGEFIAVGAKGVDSHKGAVDFFNLGSAGLFHNGRVMASDAESYDYFGSSISLDANQIQPKCVIGAYGDGSAYIFDRIGRVWTQIQKLTPSDEPRIFGYSVALEGNICLVGSPTALVEGVTRGAVYVFKYNGSNWEQIQKFSSSDGQFGDQFGQSIAISGNRCIVGATGDNGGSAYIFDYNGTAWIQSEKLRPHRTSSLNYGCSVDIYGDDAVVGATGDSEAAYKAGAAFAYRFNSNNWNTWKVKIVASDAQANDAFGVSVAVNEQNIAVGAYLKDDPESTCGSVYYFRKDGVYDFWIREVAIISSSDIQSKDYFGKSVDLQSNFVVCGAPVEYREPSYGKAYLFDLSCPESDITFDCRVDFEDFAELAEQWSDGYDWSKPILND